MPASTDISRSPFKAKTARSLLPQLKHTSTSASRKPIPRTKSSGDLRDANVTDIVQNDWTGPLAPPDSAKKKKNVVWLTC